MPGCSWRIPSAARAAGAVFGYLLLALVGLAAGMTALVWPVGAGACSPAIRELTYLALLAAGFAFFWTLLRVDPVPKEYSYAVSMWITGAEVIGDAFLGIAVIASQNLIGADWYHALGRPWGPSLQTDQVLGGGVLWILGDLVGLPFLAAQLIQLMREDESDAARIDAQLDARDAGLKAEPGAEEGTKPWWEDDPRFTGRFKPT